MKTNGNWSRNRRNQGGTKVEPRRNQGGTKVEPRWNQGGTTVETWVELNWKLEQKSENSSEDK